MSVIYGPIGGQMLRTGIQRKMSTNRLIKTMTLISMLIVVLCSVLPSGYSTIEFGNVVKQPTGLWKPTDKQVQAVIQFSQQYAEKRSPWSLPVSLRKSSTQPKLLTLNKMNLIYSHDNLFPLYFDDEVMDKHGNRHGITNTIMFGSTFRLLMSWTKDSLIYTHNFTISLYPEENMNIYSHTFFIQSVNHSAESNKYLFPKFDNNIKVEIAKHKQFSYFDENLEMEFVDGQWIGPSNKHVTGIDQSELDSCTQNDCESEDRGSKSDFEFKYSKSKNGQFSVMCYNIWNMNSKSTKTDGYTRRLIHLKKTIEAADPDIIGLQEVRYEEGKGEKLGPNQIATLSEWLPQYQFVYQPAQMHPTSLKHGRIEEGVAIMSKYPIISHDYLLLFINRSNSADLHQRVLLHAEIAVPLIGKVHVFNTHLSLSHEAREQSVVQIWNHVRKFEGPVIVIGDFNAEPQEPAVKYITGQLIFPNEARSLLVDVWREANPDIINQTGYTFSSLKRLNKRIDYILHKRGNRCCKIDRTEVLDDGTRGVKAASDHLPLLAVFTINDPKS